MVVAASLAATVFLPQNKPKEGKMELRELRYFKVIAELSSFSKAAMQLRIAQPALSRQMHKLELDLGVDLFLRHGRGVTLTPAGRTLLERAQALLRDMRRTREDVVNCASAATGSLTIGMPPAAGRVLMPPLLARYRQLCPNVNLHVVEGFSGHLHEWLVGGRTDIAILHNPDPATDLICTKLLEEEMYLCAPPGTATADTITLAEVAEQPLILPAFPHSLRQLVAGAFARQGFLLKPAIEVDGLSIIKALVQQGLGNSVLAYSAVPDEVRRGELTATRIVRPGIGWSLSMVMRRDLRQNRAAEQMAILVQEEVEKLVGSGLWRGKPH
jgi:LysR family nitrogen assimilation transcriptional regulator